MKVLPFLLLMLCCAVNFSGAWENEKKLENSQSKGMKQTKPNEAVKTSASIYEEHSQLDQVKQTRPAKEDNLKKKERKPEEIHQKVVNNPLIQVDQSNSEVSAQWLPSGIQFAEDEKDEGLYKQTKPFANHHKSLDKKASESAQTLPGSIQFQKDTKPFLMRGFPGKQTKPFEVNKNKEYNPWIESLPLDPSISASTLPGVIGYETTDIKKQTKPFLAKNVASKQTKPFGIPNKLDYNPLIRVETHNAPNSAQTLPGLVQFASKQTKPFGLQYKPLIQILPSSPSVPAQTLPGLVQFEEVAPQKQTKLFFQEDSASKQTKPFGLRNSPRYYPLIQSIQEDPSISAQTLPGIIQFRVTNKERRPFGVHSNPSAQVLSSSIQSLPGLLQYETTSVKKQTKPFLQEDSVIRQTIPSNLQTNPNYNPLIQVVTSGASIPAQTLPGLIQFATTEQASPHRQTANPKKQTKPAPEMVNSFTPLVKVQQTENSIPVQTIPGLIQFATEKETASSAAGQQQRKETKPYFALNHPLLQAPQSAIGLLGRSGIRGRTLPGQTLLFRSQGKDVIQRDVEDGDYIMVLPVDTELSKPPQITGLPSPARSNPFLASTGGESQFNSPENFLPGVSTRPRYPPGYIAAETATTPSESGLPKTVLYIF